jgi:hypothetical protein
MAVMLSGFLLSGFAVIQFSIAVDSRPFLSVILLKSPLSVVRSHP